MGGAQDADVHAKQVDVTSVVLVQMAARGMRRNRDLASVIGWSEAKVSRKMSGATPWTLGDLDRLAGVFGCAPGDFLADVSVVRATVRRHLSSVPVEYGEQLVLPFGSRPPALTIALTSAT